jgi:nitric oxide reductase activation protein
MLQSGVRITAAQGNSEELAALGLYVSDLAGKLPRERMAELQGLLRQAQSGRAAALPQTTGDGEFLYDEWDHEIGDYRHAWCRLAEIPLASDTGDFFHQTLATHAELLPEVRRQFQRIRPERYRVIHGLEDGEDFDLDAVITARADRRSGHPPSPKLYQAKQREERDVATLFLVDMSASTDEPVPDAPDGRRVIDIMKEALVVMTEALEEIGDTYGIYGFSGHGRQQVELYLVKHFNEPLTSQVKGRVGAIEPKRSTRMGAALRHAVAKMRAVAARSKHVILLSDGFPQDVDYGDDRRSSVYGIQDTTMAFQEAARAGVTPFCITVDKAGHDYLKEMCEASRYLVIDDITALPRELPKIYQRFVKP